MGKPYNHNYHFAGGGCSAGRMICSTCNEPVFNHAHDWVAYRQDRNGDWGYVTHHRKCYADQSGWEKIEAAHAKEAAKDAAIMAAINKICADFGVNYNYLIVTMEEQP